MERDGKRIRISVEPHNESKIYSFTEDGQENSVVEPSSSEKFAQMVRQIDFDALLDENEEEKEGGHVKLKSKGKGKSEKVKEKILPSQKEWEWKKVAEALFHARVEAEQIISLVDSIQTKKQLDMVNIPKPTVSDRSQLEDLVLEKHIKQKELTNVAKVLEDSANRLKALVDKEKVYFDDLLQIRQQWLLTSKAPSGKKAVGSVRQVGRIFVDYGYKSVGSKVPTTAELVQTPSGRVAVLLPPIPLKYLAFGSEGKLLPETLSTFESVERSDDVNFRLAKAQRAHFLTEMFDVLTSNALGTEIEGLELFENQLRIENDEMRTLEVHLCSQEGSHVIPKAPEPQPLSSIPFPVLEVILHQLMREWHLRKFREMSNLPEKKSNSKTVVNETLDRVVHFYRHWELCQQVLRVLEAIALQVPHMCLFRRSTGKGLTSAFEVVFGRRFNLEIIISRMSISLGGGPVWTSATSAEDLGRVVLHRVANHILTEAFKGAIAYGLTTKKEHLSLSISQGQRTLSISFSISQLKLQLLLNETGGALRDSHKVEWADLLGDSVETKLRNLFCSMCSSAPPTVPRTQSIALSKVWSPLSPKRQHSGSSNGAFSFESNGVEGFSPQEMQISLQDSEAGISSVKSQMKRKRL